MSEPTGVLGPTCPECGLDCRVIALADSCGLGRIAIPQDAQAATIDGRSADLEDAIKKSAELLANSRSPLIYGLAHSTTGAQRSAVALADRIGACIEIEGGASPALFPDLGIVSCTLGEVKNRADLVLFWCGQPAQSHPRLLRDYAIGPPGLFRPNGRGDRTVIVIGDKMTADLVAADEFVPFQPGNDFAALWLLRALVQGRAVEPNLQPVGGVTLPHWQAIAERLRRCRFGVMFIDRQQVGSTSIEAAYGLATDLAEHTRFHVMPLMVAGNAAGGEQVFTWQTGYPSAISLSAGYPRSFGDEYSAERMLSAGEADAVLFVETNFDSLSSAARTAIRRIPSIALSSQIASMRIPTTVAITTSACANPAGDVAFRFDGLALPLRQSSSASFPDEFQVLKRIEEFLRRMAAPR